MLEKALKEYRRALVINPYSYDARLLYADIFKRKDYIERYLLILSALVKDGYGNTDIQDDVITSYSIHYTKLYDQMESNFRY